MLHKVLEVNIGGKKAGSFGDVAGTSFFPAKPLGCYGDGGAIFTNEDDLASKLKSIRVHGAGEDKYSNIRIGINGRLDSLQAAILLEKIEIFDNELELRNSVANYYTQNINKMFIPPHIPDKYYSSWAQYSILAPEGIDRDSDISKAKSKMTFQLWFITKFQLIYRKVIKNTNTF